MQLKLKGFVHQWEVLTLWVQLLNFINLHSTEIIKMEIGKYWVKWMDHYWFYLSKSCITTISDCFERLIVLGNN